MKKGYTISKNGKNEEVLKFADIESRKPFYLLDCNGNYEWVDTYKEGIELLLEKEKQFPDDEWELFSSDDESEWSGYQKF